MLFTTSPKVRLCLWAFSMLSATSSVLVLRPSIFFAASPAKEKTLSIFPELPERFPMARELSSSSRVMLAMLALLWLMSAAILLTFAE